MSVPATGGCACGAVAYVGSAEPVWTVYCHCADCRRATGAPVSLWVGFADRDVAMTGPVAWRVGRLAAVARAFCGICGSPIAYRDTSDHPDEIYLTAGTMDHPAAVTPQGHAFWRERLPFVVVADDLPRFEASSRITPEKAGR